MKKLYSAIRNRQSAIGSWLPDMDLNHDKQIQSLLCYRYTIGQAGAWDRLKGFISQSSRQRSSKANELKSIHARPHPGPLPRGEGEAGGVAREFVRYICNHRLPDTRFKPNTTTSGARIATKRQIILPLLGGEGRGEGGRNN